MATAKITLTLDPDEYAQLKRYLADHRTCLDGRYLGETDPKIRQDYRIDRDKLDDLRKGI